MTWAPKPRAESSEERILAHRALLVITSYGTLFPVLYTRTLLFISFMYSSLYLWVEVSLQAAHGVLPLCSSEALERGCCSFHKSSLAEEPNEL